MSDFLPSAAPSEPTPGEPVSGWDVSSDPASAAAAAPVAVAATAWYRRRPAKVAAAGVAATAVVIGGLSVLSTASASDKPADPITSAFAALNGDEPVAVTITTTDEPDSSLRLVHTDAGTQIGFTSSDGTFELAVNGNEERLFFRIDADELGALKDDPMTAAMLSGFSSVGALAEGEWVSVDVSPDSKVLAAIASAAPQAGVEVPDTTSFAQGSDELSADIEAIVAELHDPVVDAIEAHAQITQPDATPAADGSQRYHVVLDGAAVLTDLEDDLTNAFESVLTAVEDLMGEDGAIPGVDGGTTEVRKDFTDEFAKAKAEAGKEALEADFFVKDGKLTKVAVDEGAITFDADSTLDDLSGAVSMDDDLVGLLPMLASFQALGGGLGA